MPALSVVIVLGIALRILEVVFAPRPYGYIYDFYHFGVETAWWKRRLPLAADCWQCHHPPLFYVLELPLFAVGRVIHKLWPAAVTAEVRAMSVLPVLCGAACVYYGHRILRLLTLESEYVVLGTAFLCLLPVLFVSSYGLEADILLGALMTAMLYFATKYASRSAARTTRTACVLGGLAGLACATKYSGLVSIPFLVCVFAESAWAGRRRLAVSFHAALAIAICLGVGSWKYIDNVERYGTPLFSNGTALAGFQVLSAPTHASSYEFTSFRLPSLLALTREDSDEGLLTHLPIYKSFWTAMYGLTWNDLGMFTKPSRHGNGPQTYPSRHVPPILASGVMVFGLVPSVLALIGLIVTAFHRFLRPFVYLTLLSAAAYVPWVLRQDEWALKPKYLLFLAPVYAACAVVGTMVVSRWLPTAARVGLSVLWVVGLTLTAVYLGWFSAAPPA